MAKEKKLICNDCGKELPSDSKFCQYCGSKNITEYIEPKQVYTTPTKICAKCGMELPEDSKYCQYCGSEEIKEETISIKTDNSQMNSIKRNVLFIPLIVVSLIACGLGYGMYRNYREYNNLLAVQVEEEKELSALRGEVNRQRNTLNTYRDKAGYFDSIKNSGSYTSNTRFFVSNTVLRTPNKTRVVFYIPYNGSYYINWESEQGITTTSGNTSSGLVYMDVTYTGPGVKKIICTNNVNDEKIIIYCIGIK